MSKTTPPTAKEVLDKLPLESLYPNAKKSLTNAPSKAVDQNMEKLIDDYIDKAGRNPKAINGMIEAKRGATKEVISQARNFYTEENTKLNGYKKELKDESSLKKDAKYNENIVKIQENISEIQECIDTIERNVSTNISRPFDKKFDAAKEKNKLMKLFDNKTQKEINALEKAAKQINSTATYQRSEKEIANKLKQTTKALKAWQELSKARDDRDRSKGFAKLSDNLASMATTSVNAPRKALALGQALLTYAVVDVLYTGLVKGTAKGLVKGADTGYSAANERVKKVANNLHKMIINPQKKLDKKVEKLMGGHSEEINGANIAVFKFANKKKIEELHKALVENSKTSPKKEYVSVKDYLDTLAPKDKATMFIAFLNERGNTKDANFLQTAHDNFIAASTPSLPTRVVAGAVGIVPATVTGIVNAAWEGIKKPTLAATVDMPKGVGNRLTNLKKGKEWARTHSEVKQHREAKKMAEAIGAYAKKAKPEEFKEMVKKEKEKKQKQNKQFKKTKGVFRT